MADDASPAEGEVGEPTPDDDATADVRQSVAADAAPADAADTAGDDVLDIADTDDAAEHGDTEEASWTRPREPSTTTSGGARNRSSTSSRRPSPSRWATSRRPAWSLCQRCWRRWGPLADLEI